MAPAFIDTPLLAKRQFYNGYSNCDSYGNCYSRWNSWGRWVVLAAIIVAAILVFLMLACFNARRRRRHGLNPRYGTGWAAGKTPQGHTGLQYTNDAYYGGNANYAQPAPPYTAPAQYNATGNSNTGYYGQESGVELQQPQNAYVSRGGEEVYAAPNGPPPKKGDGIIR